MKQFEWRIAYPLSIDSQKDVFESIPEEFRNYLKGNGRESYEFFFELIIESKDTQFIVISPFFLQRIASFSKFQKRMRRSYSDDFISASFDYVKIYKMIQYLVQSGETWLFSYSFEQ
jgi:hypothetical protein